MITDTWWQSASAPQRVVNGLHSVIYVGMVIHLVGYFLITNQIFHTNLFYGLVGLPVVALIMLQGRAQLSHVRQVTPAFALLFALALSVTWSADPLFAWNDVMKHGLTLSTLFLAVTSLAPKWRSVEILDGYVLLGSAYAVWMLLIYFLPEIFSPAATYLGVEGYLGSGIVGWHSWHPRITHGGNFLVNPVFAAMFCGGALLYAIHVFLTTQFWGRATIAAFCVVPLLLFLVLLQSRGPLFALGLALLALPFVCRARLDRLLVLLVLASGGVALVHFATDIFVRVFERGEMRFLMSGFSLGARGDIYQYCVAEGASSLFTGIGLTPGLIVEVPGNPHHHCHSVPIDVFRFSGLIGLGAFGWLVFAALLRCVRVSNLAPWGLVSGYFLVALMFDGMQPLQKPGPLWAMFWVPLVMALVIPAPRPPG